MFDFQIIDEILSIDPSYIALFAAMIFGVMQALKGLGGWLQENALAVVLLMSVGLATLIVLGHTTIIAILALAQVIAAAASGIYGWGKKKEEVIKFPDYSDES